MENKYIAKIQKFMYGRYGTDELYNFLFKLYIVLLIIDLFVKWWGLLYLELLVVIIMLYRMFSKNISRRKKENKKFLNIKNAVMKPFCTWNKQVRDKNNIYKKCNKCKTVIRLPLPSSYGIKHVKCPKCKKKLSVLCLRKEKIEVIKKSKGRSVKRDV